MVVLTEVLPHWTETEDKCCEQLLRSMPGANRWFIKCSIIQENDLNIPIKAPWLYYDVLRPIKRAPLGRTP